MGEIAMAVMLVAAAGLTIRSLQELMQQDLGLNTRGVLTFTVGITDARQNDSDALTRFFDDLESRIRAAARRRVRRGDQHAADCADRIQWSGPRA